MTATNGSRRGRDSQAIPAEARRLLARAARYAGGCSSQVGCAAVWLVDRPETRLTCTQEWEGSDNGYRRLDGMARRRHAYRAVG